MSYTLADDPHILGQKVLMKENKVVNCPHHPPMHVKAKFGTDVAIQYKGCGTWCALFHDGFVINATTRKPEWKGISQQCGTGQLIAIDTENTPENTPETNLPD